MRAWLFDVDGVITNPELKEANPKILDKIVKFLNSGDIIGFNTGRSLKFTIKEILEPLKSKITDESHLEKIFSVGEKGGDWALFENGDLKIKTDESIKPPKELEERIKSLIEEKFSDTIFFDSTKKTMISAEIIKDTELSKFHEDQKRFDEEVEQILKEMKLTNLKIDSSIIATDIQNPKVGKDLGVQRFLNMIKGLHEPSEFETFGDSPGDLEMYKYLVKNGHKAKFIYVGKKEIEDEENIIKTKAKYDEGTLEYLTSN